jgi:MFS transporter, DHA1 family, multidrug resistance protein
VMARALTGLGIVALTGPVAGALLVDIWGWRTTFAACTVYVTLAFGLVIWQMPETLKVRNPEATRLRPLMTTWRRIGSHPGFITWTLLTSFTYGAIYAFLAGSSFLYINIMGVPKLGYGLAVSSVTFAYVLGTLACHRSLPRWGMQRTVQRAALMTVIGALALLLIVWTGGHTPWTVTLASMCIAFGHAHHQSCGQAALPAPFPQHAGTASALAGFCTALVAFGLGGWLGLVLDRQAAPLLLTQATMALLTAAVAWRLIPRHGQSSLPRPHTVSG